MVTYDVRHGDLVAYDDYAKLEQENAKLKAQLEELQKGPDMDAVGLGAEPSYRALWARNKVLEGQLEASSICELCEKKAIAQLSNTRLGLEKMEKLIKSKTKYGPSGYIDYRISKFFIVGVNHNDIDEAPTLADLIDKVVLMEVAHDKSI